MNIHTLIGFGALTRSIGSVLLLLSADEALAEERRAFMLDDAEARALGAVTG